MLSVLRQLRSKDGAGGGGGAGCRAGPGHAALSGAQPGAAFSTAAVNLRQIEFGEFGTAVPKTPRWAPSEFLQISNQPFYQLRHTSLVNI